MSISVWLPLLFRYLEALSKRHAEKIKCPLTGVHSFPALALYDALFDTPDQFRADHPEMSPMDVLQVMESFNRATKLLCKG
jgi:hypothetical protein